MARVNLSMIPTGDILIKGRSDAPILVITDAPTYKAYKAGLIMDKKTENVFARYAKKYGFSRNDFSFVTPCPPLPAECKVSDARERLWLEAFKGIFLETVDEFSPEIIIYLGKTGGRQFTQKAVKITKVRGQVYRMEDGKLVFPMLSPGHVLRRPEIKETFEADWRILQVLRDSGWDDKKLAEMKKGVSYKWVTDLSFLLKNPPDQLFVDTEFVNLNWYEDSHRLLTVQLTDKEGKAYLLPLDPKYYTKIGYRIVAKLKSQLNELFNNPEIKVAGFSFKIDIHVLRKAGIRVSNWFVDTQMLAFAVDENMMEKSQAECVKRWTAEMGGYSDFFDRKYDKSRMDLVPLSDMKIYAGGDVDSGIRLTDKLFEEVKKDSRQLNVLRRVQMPALRTFARMEEYGIRIDKEELRRLRVNLVEKEKKDYASLIRRVPASIKRKHIALPNQKNKPVEKVLSFTRDDFIRDVLFSEQGFGLEPIVFTASTAKLPVEQRVPSVSAKDHLPYFSDSNFVVDLIAYKKLAKMLSTYVGSEHDKLKGGPTGFWQYLEHSTDGRIHPSFLLHRTVTGRSSSASPNAQNFPKRGELAKAFRKIFIPSEGYSFIEVDLSQAELRIAAWMANELNMLKIYRRGGDIHTATAAAVMGITVGQFMQLSKDERGLKRFQAKAVNFGFLYGMGWRGFKTYAKTDYGLDFTEEQAKRMRRVFFETYPGLVTWHNAMRRFVREHGHVRSLHGAVRHLPNIYSNDEGIQSGCERMAINSPVQRFASDLGLIGMIRFGRDVDWNEARPVAFIHDSCIVEAVTDKREEYAKYLKWYMQTPPLEDWFNLKPPLPIVADASIGDDLTSMEEQENLEAVQPDWFGGDDD